MKSLSKTRPLPTWNDLSADQQALLKRLCATEGRPLHVLTLPLHVVTLTEKERTEDADALLDHGFVEWRDGFLKIKPEGLCFFVQKSGLFPTRKVG